MEWAVSIVTTRDMTALPDVRDGSFVVVTRDGPRARPLRDDAGRPVA